MVSRPVVSPPPPNLSPRFLSLLLFLVLPLLTFDFRASLPVVPVFDISCG